MYALTILLAVGFAALAWFAHHLANVNAHVRAENKNLTYSLTCMPDTIRQLESASPEDYYMHHYDDRSVVGIKVYFVRLDIEDYADRYDYARIPVKVFKIDRDADSETRDYVRMCAEELYEKLTEGI